MKKFMAVAVMLLLSGCGSSSGPYTEYRIYGPGNPSALSIPVCDRRVDYPMAPLPAGMCNDPRHPGSMVQESFLIRNPRYACFGEVWANGVDPRAPRPSVQQPSAPVQKQEAPRNKFERPENIEKKADKKIARLTVENYTEEGAVVSECQTKNWGAASVCLRNKANILEELQLKCEEEINKKDGVKNPECEDQPGVVAGEYEVLSEELRKHQEKMQGRKFTRPQ